MKYAPFFVFGTVLMALLSVPKELKIEIMIAIGLAYVAGGLAMFYAKWGDKKGEKDG